MSERALVGALLGLLLAPPALAERDPTRPPGFGAVTTPAATAGDGQVDLRLSGIISGPRGSSAVINGRRVRAGDQVADAQVVAVDHQGVEIERGGERFVIKLTTTEVKRRSPPVPREN